MKKKISLEDFPNGTVLNLPIWAGAKEHREFMVSAGPDFRILHDPKTGKQRKLSDIDYATESNLSIVLWP